jgi:TatD DNase family protein
MSVDAHCHIDLHRNPKAVVASAVAAGLRLVAVTTTPAAFKVSAALTDSRKGILPALGMHPEVVGSRAKDASLFTQHIGNVAWVGEIGLDGSPRFSSFWDMQVAVFEQVLRDCSEAGGRVMSIHSRAASAQVLEMLSKYPSAGTPVLHWFSGKQSEVQTALDMGAFFSVNGKMLESHSGQAIALKVPLHRILTESDAPFASSDSRSISDQIHSCELKLAQLYEVETPKIREYTNRNFDYLLGVPT